MSQARIRLLPALLAALLVLFSFGPGFHVRAETGPFSSYAVVSPSSLPAGNGVEISAYVTAAVTEAVFMTVDVYDKIGRRVHEQAYEIATLSAGETRELKTAWHVPVDAIQGDYRVRVLVQNERKTVMRHLNSQATLFKVTAPEVPLWTAMASVTPDPVEVGHAITITADVISAADKDALIDLEMFDTVDRKVFSRTYENQHLTANQPKTYTETWTIPGDGLKGTYKVRIVVYRPDRGVMYAVLKPATFTVNPHPDPYATSAAVSESTVLPGSTVTITADVTALEAVDALVDVQVYHQDGRRVTRQTWDNQTLPAGELKQYQFSWEVYPGDPGGTYTVKIGIFKPGWGVLYWWNDRAAQFTVDSPVAYATSVTGPDTTKTGETVTFTASVESATDTDVLVHLFLYGPQGLTHQQVFDNQHLAAGTAAPYTLSWYPPGGAPAGEYTVKVGLFTVGWGRLFHWNDQALKFTLEAGATVPPPTETPPPAQHPLLPAHLGVGAAVPPSQLADSGWLASTGVPFDYAYQYLAGGVNTGQGWATWNPSGQFALNYAKSADARGAIPVLTYYQMLHSLGSCNACGEVQRDLSNLNNPETMAAYYADFALLMKRLGTGSHDGIEGFGKTAIVHVEPDLSGYANQAVLRSNRCFNLCTGTGNDPALLKAAVASTGVPELAELPDTYLGFNQALLKLRDLYAPNVLLAFHVSNWTNFQDIGGSTSTVLDAAGSGAEAGAFAARSGVAETAPGLSAYDLIFNDVSDRDAGYYKYVIGRQNAFWDKLNITFPNFHRWEAFLASAVRAAGKPAFIWQIPLGNQYFKTMNNTPGHYQDNKAEYFFGHMEELAQVGVVGLLFGAGSDAVTKEFDARGDGVTNPDPVCTADGVSSGQVCNDHDALYPDDDGGYLRMMAEAYYKAPVVLPR